MEVHRILALTLLLATVFILGGQCQEDDDDMMMVDDDYEEEYDMNEDMMGMGGAEEMMGMGGEEAEEEEPAPKVARPKKYFEAPEMEEGSANIAELFLNPGVLGSK